MAPSRNYVWLLDFHTGRPRESLLPQTWLESLLQDVMGTCMRAWPLTSVCFVVPAVDLLPLFGYSIRFAIPHQPIRGKLAWDGGTGGGGGGVEGGGEGKGGGESGF